MRPLQALAQGLLRGGFAAQVLLVSILKPLIFRSEYEQIGPPDLQELVGTLENAIQDFQPGTSSRGAVAAGDLEDYMPRPLGSLGSNDTTRSTLSTSNVTVTRLGCERFRIESTSDRNDRDEFRERCAALLRSIPSRSQPFQQVPHLFLFGAQVRVPGVERVSQAWNSFGNVNAGGLHGVHLFRIVGKETHRPQTEVLQNHDGQFVAAQIGAETQPFVGLYSVGALVLQLVSTQLVEQPDATAFLVLVDQETASEAGDGFERDFELGAAIAAEAVKDVAGQTLGMNADERRLAGREIAHLQGDGFLGPAVRQLTAKPEDPEEAKFRWEVRFGHLFQPKRRGIVHAQLLGILILLL